MKLFLINLGLVLANFVSINAQSPTPSAVQLPTGCGLNGLPGYIDTQLTGLGFNAQQVQALNLPGTNIMAAIEQTAMQTIMWPNAITGPNKYNYAQLFPESIILYTLDLIWYNGINNIQPQPWGDLKNLDTQLTNAISGNTCITDTKSGNSLCSMDNATCSNTIPIVPCANDVALSQSTCGALFSCENIECLPYAYGTPGGSIGLCEEVLYQTQLYNNLLAIAQAKNYAYQDFCYLPQYSRQYPDLPTCINTMAQNMLKGVIKPGSLIPSKATPTKAINDVSNIIDVLNTFNGWFLKLQLCCQTASATCEAQYGTDYSLSAMAKTIQQSQFAHLAQTNIALNLAYPSGQIWVLGFQSVLSNGGQASLLNSAWQNIEAVCGAFTWSNLPSDPIDIVPTGPCGLNLMALADLSNSTLVFTNQLFIAIQLGDLTNVQSNIQNGANINATDYGNNNMTPLMYAAQATNTNALAILQYLLTIPKINVYIADTNGHTALWYAQNSTVAPAIKTAMIQAISTAQLFYGVINLKFDVDQLRALISVGGINSINAQDINGMTPLMHALKILGSIFSAKSVNQYSYVGYLPLLSTTPGSGYNFSLKDNNGNRVSNYIQNLPPYPADFSYVIGLIIQAQLFYDVSNNIAQLTDIQTDIAAGANINTQNSNGITPLMYAAQSTSSNAPAIVQYFLTIPNININLTDNQGHTVLWYAQNSTNPQKTAIIRALLPTPQQLTAQLISDITSNYNSSTIANITADLAAGASLTTPDSTGKSALMYAITNPGGANSTTAQMLEIFNTVLAAAVSQNLIQKNSTPKLSNVIAPMTIPILIYVLQNSGLAYIDQNTGMLQSLLKVPNIDVTAVSSTGENILDLAAQANYTTPSTIGFAYQIIQLLLSAPAAKATINTPDGSGCYALDWAQNYFKGPTQFQAAIVQALQAAGGQLAGC